MNKDTYDRAKALITKYISLQLRNLRPTAIHGRFVGPKVLINSIPKAGSNLLEQALGQFPLLHRSGFCALRGWETVSSSTLNKIRHFERGGVALGHLPAHSYFESLPDDHARLLAAINGVNGVVSPASETLNTFCGWLNSNAMVVRFEDIIGSKGGSDEKQLGVVNNDIADFIGINISNLKFHTFDFVVRLIACFMSLKNCIFFIKGIPVPRSNFMGVCYKQSKTRQNYPRLIPTAHLGNL